MFERFTERARKVVVLAQKEAGRLRHDYVGTEHLLLGLLCEREGVAAQALTASGITLDGGREQVETTVGYGKEPAGAQMPFTRRAKNALEASFDEAMGMRHNYIGTEHLLLGLLRGPEDSAAKMISNVGADPEVVRREVMKLLGETLGTRPTRDPGRMERTREVLRRAFRRGPREGQYLFLMFTAEGRRVVVLAQDEARNLFRGRVGGIRTELFLPRPLAVTVDADYAYRTQVGLPHSSTTVEPGNVADQIRDGLRETEARGLEAVIAMLGGRVLSAFPAMLEVSVSVSGVPEPADPPAPTFSVSSTFRR